MHLYNIKSSKYSKVYKGANLLLIGQCSLRVYLLVGRNQFLSRQQYFRKSSQLNIKLISYLFNIGILAEPELSIQLILFNVNFQKLLQVSQYTDLILVQQFSFKFFQSLKVLFGKQDGNIVYIKEDNKLFISVKVVRTWDRLQSEFGQYIYKLFIPKQG